MIINAFSIIVIFTFIIHFTESIVYTLRLAGIRTKQIATALSLITSLLLISRLSNMVQAPFVGNLVDQTIQLGTPIALTSLEWQFRIIIFSAFLGSLFGALFSPTATLLLQRIILKFIQNGSFIKTIYISLKPRHIYHSFSLIQWPSIKHFRHVSWTNLPKTFLVINIFVTSIYTIGVLCAMLAGAYLPEYRATAIQLSGIVNGIATILFATLVDPTGARITDQAHHKQRPESDVKSVIIFLLAGRLIGTLIIAQLLFYPFTQYILVFTKLISTYF